MTPILIFWIIVLSGLSLIIYHLIVIRPIKKPKSMGKEEVYFPTYESDPESVAKERELLELCLKKESKMTKRKFQLVIGEGEVLEDDSPLLTFLENRRGDIDIEIICKMSDQALKNHKRLSKLIKDGYVKFYNSPRRPKLHFNVLDNKHVYIQNVHPPGDRNRGWYFKLNTVYLGKKLSYEFKHLSKICVPPEETFEKVKAWNKE